MPQGGGAFNPRAGGRFSRRRARRDCQAGPRRA
jgi:hypothetical protein